MRERQSDDDTLLQYRLGPVYYSTYIVQPILSSIENGGSSQGQDNDGEEVGENPDYEHDQ